jgi:hypothetical protein
MLAKWGLHWCGVKRMWSLFVLSLKFPQLSASKYSWVTSQCSQLTMASPSTSRDNGTDERQEEIVHVGLGGVSSKSVWENIDSFPTSRETFCNVYGPQFNTAEVDVVECVWKHSWYCPCTAHCRRNQQVCSAGNIGKHQTSHISL